MTEQLLSKEALELLKRFDQGATLPASDYQDSRIQHLSSLGFIDSHIVTYEGTSFFEPVFSDYCITEKGRAYLHSLEQDQLTWTRIESLANSAIKKATKASATSWIAVVIAFLALLLQAYQSFFP